MTRAQRQATPADVLTSVLVVLTGHAGMRAMHQRWMGQATTTDVLSQRYDPLPGEAAGGQGEIIVNVTLAQELGPRHWGGRPVRVAATRELALYVAHGCDHLAGAIDGTPAERVRMRRRELRWLREAEACGMLKGLLPVRKTVKFPENIQYPTRNRRITK